AGPQGVCAWPAIASTVAGKASHACHAGAPSSGRVALVAIAVRAITDMPRLAGTTSRSRAPSAARRGAPSTTGSRGLPFRSDPVLAIALRLVQRGVGNLEERLSAQRRRTGGDAKARRHRRVPDRHRETQLGHLATEPLGEGRRTLEIRLGQEHRELL